MMQEEQYKNLTGFFLPISISALALGMKDIPIHWDKFGTYLFAVFYILFRIKIYVDDINEIKTSKNDAWLKFGFLIFGPFFWFIWVLAGYKVACLTQSISWILISLVLATIYLIIKACYKKDTGEICRHITYNLGYIFIGFIYIIYTNLVMEMARKWSCIFILLMIFICIYDLRQSYK
jgi:hypothetical protein